MNKNQVHLLGKKAKAAEQKTCMIILIFKNVDTDFTTADAELGDQDSSFP